MSSHNQIETKITFLLEKQPLFQITTCHQLNTQQTLRQILSHIMRTICVSHKQNSQDFIIDKLLKQPIIHSDKQLLTIVNMDDNIQTSCQQLFYNFTMKEYDFINSKNNELDSNAQVDKQSKKRDGQLNMEIVLNNNQNNNQKSIEQNKQTIIKTQVVNSKRVHVQQQQNVKQQQQIKTRALSNQPSSTTQGCCQLV